jgi:hypothetical protein
MAMPGLLRNRLTAFPEGVDFEQFIQTVTSQSARWNYGTVVRISGVREHDVTVEKFDNVTGGRTGVTTTLPMYGEYVLDDWGHKRKWEGKRVGDAEAQKRLEDYFAVGTKRRAYLIYRDEGDWEMHGIIWHDGKVRPTLQPFLTSKEGFKFGLMSEEPGMKSSPTGRLMAAAWMAPSSISEEHMKFWKDVTAPSSDIEAVLRMTDELVKKSKLK